MEDDQMSEVEQQDGADTATATLEPAKIKPATTRAITIQAEFTA